MKPICSEWEERLSLYVDGLLNPFDENAVEAHLSRCEACRAAVALWREVGQSIRRLPRELPPADLRARILASTTRKPSLAQRLRLGGWALAPALGVGLLLAYLTLPRSIQVAVPGDHTVEVGAASRTVAAESPAVSESSESVVRPVDADTRVVIVVQPAPSPRWRAPSPRWVVTPRAPAPVPAPAHDAPSVAAASHEGTRSTPSSAAAENSVPNNPSAAVLPRTEVADLPLPAESSPTGVEGAPQTTSGTTQVALVKAGAPSPGESLALSRWSEQFNRELQQGNRRALLRQISTTQQDNRFFVPILSWNIK
jgi:hypothetical protein